MGVGGSGQLAVLCLLGHSLVIDNIPHSSGVTFPSLNFPCQSPVRCSFSSNKEGEWSYLCVV